MDPAALKPAKEALLREVEKRRRDPFPIFLRCWALTWVPEAAAVALLAALPKSGAAWVAAALVAGFTQNALGVLMHEGSHYFFHRNKRANDVWANLLVCLPIFNTVGGYRALHAEHHRSSGEEADPYYELYTAYPTRGHLLRSFVLDFLGVSAVAKFVQRYRSPGSGAVREARYVLPCLALIQAGIAGILFAATGRWFAYFVLWLLPLMSLPIFINRFRTIVEHYPGFAGIKVNRTSVTGWLEYLCIAPYGYGNHLEHHLMPQIPYYELGFAHRFLESRGAAFTENEVNTKGYLRTFLRQMREMGKG